MHWGAVLLEEDMYGKRQIYGYKSGSFSYSQIYYHSTMKELLAVKKAIEKFEFHLVGHHFLVETNFSGFQMMLTFKNKRVLKAQLVRLAT